MESGIYIIRNTINNKVYIGKSVLIKSRLYHHKSALKGKRHKNTHLQKSYNKYGVDSFIFEVLEKCPEEYLSAQEGLWINIFQSHLPEYGYNIDYINEEGMSNRNYDRRIIEKEPNYLLINLQTGEHFFYKQIAAIYKELGTKYNSKLTDLISNQKKFYNNQKIDKKSYKNLLLININYYYDLNYLKYIYTDNRYTKSDSPVR